MSTVNAPIVEVGDRTALICDESTKGEILNAALNELGFKCYRVETPDIGIERIKHTLYDVIGISETFAGSSLESNALLRYLAPLPMDQRRNSYVFLVGSSFRTLDAMQAYRESVHLVVHPNDLANLRAILKKGLADFKTFYKTYREIQAETGEIR